MAGFLATTNAGRVALACRESQPPARSLAVALLAGLGLVVAGVLLADELLDALEISPESFRIATGIVLGATGVWTIVWPRPPSGPFAAVLVTPELACFAVSAGADEPVARALGAAALALPLVAVAAIHRTREPTTRSAQLLASLQLVVAVALVVSGVRDV